jgi:diadenosine tetraphosphate (Ap4A) HIT family hydrolase
MAIYNIAPILRGHSLVIPKKHIESVMDLNHAEHEEFFQFARNVTRVLLSAFKGEGFDWSLQQGIDAGQSESHLHLHIVIRKPDDMDQGEEWYQKVRDNEQSLLDSSSRQRLSDEEYSFYTDYLINEAKLFPGFSEEKE